MTEKFIEIRSLKNETLIERTTKLAERERVVTAELVLHLAELERRKAYREMIRLIATISREISERLEALKVELSSKYPTGATIAQLLTKLLNYRDDVEGEKEERLRRKDRKREEAGESLPSTETSSIPLAVEMAVSERRQHRCSLVSCYGIRRPAKTLTDTRLLCRCRNQAWPSKIRQKVHGEEDRGGEERVAPLAHPELRKTRA